MLVSVLKMYRFFYLKKDSFDILISEMNVFGFSDDLSYLISIFFQ